MNTTPLAWMIGLPLIGFLINGIIYGVFEKKLPAKVSGTIASAAIFGSFIIALTKFFELKGLDPAARFMEHTIFQWMTVDGGVNIPFKLALDPLSSAMSLVVTGVGFLIHVYSIGYMDHDAAPAKFFTYLNLFCFAMLCLVLGASLPIMFLGWEGVGVCSYLLIGFWYEDPAKASAGKKAFIVNRIGDLGFLVGVFLLYVMFGTLDFQSLKHAVEEGAAANSLNIGLITIATMGLFVGAMGKSAQIPLYVWLPDAMAGPTPVSALIHAATMVTAGVYMITRMNFLFSLAPQTQMLVSGIGAATALFAATIAIVQRDIKKVLAYSTVSQLGYMFMAVGVGAYVAGVFHLITHAFFKALLFLGSGSVIHGMHEEQDIMKMGGLKKHMPQTWITFVIGTIAIAGIPPFAGFFSKDEILWEAFSSHHGLAGPALWIVGMITAFLTAFYMTRLTCLTFWGKERFDKHHVHPHESPLLMTLPLMILAVLSIVGGFIGLPGNSWLHDWLAPVLHSGAQHAQAAEEGGHNSMEMILMVVSAVVAIASVSLSYHLYVRKPEVPAKLKESMQAAYKTLFNKYYVDEIYEAIFVNPIQKLAKFCWKIIDVVLVDGIVLSFGRISRFAGEVTRTIQTGTVQVYAIFILIGILAIVGYFTYGITH